MAAPKYFGNSRRPSENTAELSMNEPLAPIITATYQQAKCLIDADTIADALRQLSARMNADLRDANPVMLVIMKGGIVFAGQLLPLLNFPLEVDFCQVSRYRGNVRGTELEWLVEPSMDLTARHVVIVDDIYDEGTTLAVLIDACKQRGAVDVKTCVLVDKQHDRKQDPDYRADYVAVQTPDRFLVGFGMDYQGFGRNLPGLYVLD
jgi:hypoxanthine phosphoribosyltransferase